MKRKQYRFMGTDSRFVPNLEYTLHEISDKSGLPHSAVRMRLYYQDSFDDGHLRELKPGNNGPKQTLAERNRAQTVRAGIIKQCVISETQYLVRGHPVAEIKVANWLESVMYNSCEFWLKMDKLTVSEIITLAVKAEPDDYLWQRRQVKVQSLA